MNTNYQENYILAQATRMNKKTFNRQITILNHLQMQIFIDIFLKLLKTKML